MNDIERYRRRRAKRVAARMDAKFEENDHPRDENGRFTSGGGGGSKAGGGVKAGGSNAPHAAVADFVAGQKRRKEVEIGRGLEHLGRRDLVKIADGYGLDTEKYNKENGKPIVPNSEIVDDIKAREKELKSAAFAAGKKRREEVEIGRGLEHLGRRDLVKIAKGYGMDIDKYDKENGKPIVPNPEIVKDIREREKELGG